MIGSLLGFIDDPALVRRYRALALASALVRAATVLSLFPLLRELFSDDPEQALPWLALLVVLVVGGWRVEQPFARAGFDVGFRLLGTIEQRVLDRLERIPLPALDATVAGSAQQALRSAGRELLQSFVYVLSPLAANLTATVLIGVGLAVISPWLGLVALVALVLLSGAMWVSGRLLRASETAYDAASADVGQRIVEFAQAQSVLRAAGASTGEESQLDRALVAQRGASLRLLGLTIPGTLLFTLTAQATLAGLAAVAVALTRSGDLSPAEVVALVVVAVRFLEPFTTMADFAPAIEIARSALRRIDRVLAVPVLETEEPRVGSAVADPDAPVLALRDVHFSYPDGPEVLAGIDLTVRRGQTVAVVGPSGSGKSTLLSLASRFADPTSGRVLVEGTDARRYDLTDLMTRIAAVFQQVYLLDLPIVENVRLARPDATDDEVAAAAAAAQLDEMVERLPDGWQTRAGEGGSRLSGGERQRVSVARALLKRAPLLLLDESTSAVDALTEQALVTALREGADERATVVVAHRLATIAHADEIVFLQDGRIVERGTHAELLAADGRFAAYWRQREQAANWTLV